MNERILVVDDEKAIADLVGIYLTKEGFDVQIAYSGADAAKAILEQEFDLALLDVMLPVAVHRRPSRRPFSSTAWRSTATLVP